MLLSLTAVLLLGGSLINSHLVYQPPGDSNNPLPYCEKCVSKAQLEAPGVGLDLSTSYGTAAVRYHNGSVISITKVEASPEYTSMMRRFSETKAPCSEPMNHWDRLMCDIEARRRALRKSVGLPATQDVHTLSKLITAVTTAASEDHGIPITTVKLASPRLSGYTNIDIVDALEYANLTGLSSWAYPRTELSAAFGASGGMCKNWTRVWECQNEERGEKPAVEVYAVSYTNLALDMCMEPLSGALFYQRYDDIVDWRLGKGAIGTLFPDEDWYWNIVKERLQELPRGSGWPVGTLLVMGEEGKDERFLKVLKEAITEIQGEGTFDIVIDGDASVDGGFEPLYLAAKGMALVAKRLQETQPYCEESPLCRKHRLETGSNQVVLSKL